MAINLLVLFNTLAHDPSIGYDAIAHYQNATVYAELRYPTIEDNYEYHSPPLPYLLPAVAYRLSVDLGIGEWLLRPGNTIGEFLAEFLFNGLSDPNIAVAARIGQLQQVPLSLILTWYLAKLAARLEPHKPSLQTISLLLLGSLPVYYRSFTFMRGDPFLATIAILLVYYCLVAMNEEGRKGLKFAIAIGALVGLAALSRQFGLFYGPAVAIFFVTVAINKLIPWRRAFRDIAAIAAVSLSLASAFYLPYYIQNDGSFFMKHEAYSEFAESFSFSNQPLKFYISLSLDELFSDPVRPAFLNQLIPIFYSDTFGDYHAHFLAYGWNKETGQHISASQVQVLFIDAFYYKTSTFPPAWLQTNRLTIAPYLGLVNIFALVPAALLAGGALLGGVSAISSLLKKAASIKQTHHRVLLFWLVALNAAAFFYVTITINTFEGEVIKSTYLIQIFPLLALLGAELLLLLGTRYPKLYRAILVWLIGFALFALPTFITRYIPWAR